VDGAAAVDGSAWMSASARPAAGLAKRSKRLQSGPKGP
jgi:hypothetical protein